MFSTTNELFSNKALASFAPAVWVSLLMMNYDNDSFFIAQKPKEWVKQDNKHYLNLQIKVQHKWLT